MYTYNAVVTRWIDGDTVRLDVDMGFRINSENDFRLGGIDTPERGKPGYQQAKDRVNELAPVGTVVQIVTAKADKYGRWLADVWVGETCVNLTLIVEGLAVPYFGGTK